MNGLEFAVDDHVATITLNRPDKANALDAALVESLHVAFDAAVGAQARLLVMRGAGRNFCAGFDFSGFEEMPVSELGWRFIRIEQFLQKLFHAPFETMALAQGGCFGAGADIVAACSTVVAAADAKFRMPGWRFGLALGTRRLAARVGTGEALRILRASAVLTCADALRIALVDEVLDAAQWGARIESQAGAATALALAAQTRLLGILRADTRAEDMASLIGSLCDGDLKARIAAFRSAR